MTNDLFQKIVGFVWEHRGSTSQFDYPDYGGLPKNLSGCLSLEAVDAMQYIWGDMKIFRTKVEFAKMYKRRLLELGEPLV